MKKIILLLSLLMSQLSFASANPHPNSQSPISVLIVGTGPSGLSMAKALQNNGIYPDIIERQDKISSDGAAIAIPANGSWALTKLGIDIENALLISKMTFTDDQGDLLVQEEINNIHPDGAQFYSLSRDELMKQLLSSLKKGTPVRTSTTIANFSEEDNQVKVEFSDGETKCYDFVIGCDGVRSNLRSRVHPNEVPEFLGLLVWRTVIDAPQDFSRPTYMLGSDRLISLYPMPENQLYVYGHVFQSVKTPPTGSFSDTFSAFGGYVPEILYNIDHPSGTSRKTKFYIHHMESSHSVRFKLDGFQRILLVGDASHAFGPGLQNGAAQAFEDAYVLQELLSQGVTAEKVPTIIDAFEKRRIARVKQVFNMSNVKIQAISDPQQIQGRNAAIRKGGAPNVNGFKLIMQQNP